MRFLLACLLLCILAGACKPPSRGGGAAVLQEGVSENSPNGLRRYWQVPAFELINQDGNAFYSGQMLGKVWVVDFFYTTCPGPCPALTSRLSEIHSLWASDARVGFLSVSSDPEKDQPEVLRKYALKFKADHRWVFLTGKTSAVFALANQGFKLSLTRSEGSAEPLTHSTKLALVDASGWVRGFYEGVGDESNEASARLMAGIKTLLEEMK